ncbi:hypothetical protein KIN20_029996 [Parelaphostrongylus tenuis]|uniref:Uncharacterized protein n=1 Tax=Parelaphostrongylus tenuis TaxID=148309 RepID=A0AAD5R3J8_PARTN|nr:hypothetical protein KIN20_029996 [Parelaphostrongylus tenuis]
MGYVTTIAPFFIVTILFFRAVTLEGAIDGISHFLGKPDFNKMFDRETWIAALIQICYTLEVGYGGILALSSYNHKHNNCYRSAWIVVIGNLLMGLMAGVTVFATLGYLSQQLHKPIHAVVSSGLPLVFVAYPEAMGKMPYPRIWGTLLFSMLLFFGLGSFAGYRNLYDDLSEMLGEPREDWIKFFGPHSIVWMISWRFITPLITVVRKSIVD